MATVDGPPPVSRLPRAALAALLAVLVGLTVAAAGVGSLPWALPERVFGGWQVADVPGSLVALLVASTGVCLIAGTTLVLRGARLRLAEPAALTWLAVVVVSAGALVFNALVLAADASQESGPVIPVFHWMFTLVPALLAGAVGATRGAAAATAAALGSGVVTLPLFTLGWALMASRFPFPSEVLAPLWNSLLLGVVPLLIGVAIARGWGRTREWRSAVR
jgi:hypothetical protein